MTSSAWRRDEGLPDCPRESRAASLPARRAVPTENLEPGRLGTGSASRWVLPSDLTAAQLARLHTECACAGMPREAVNVACLLVTELVANALQHGSGVVVLLVTREGARVRVQVEDESPDVPVVVEPSGPWPEHGAGMRLVAALADSWGVGPRGDGQPGKGVWFTLC